MKLYNFTRLIKKYSVTFSLERSQPGKFVAGKWENGEKTTEEMRGAIVPMSDKKIYGSGGTYTTEDRELYLITPLEPPFSDLRVIYKGNTYSVEEGRNFEDYADVGVYILKHISQAVTNGA